MSPFWDGMSWYTTDFKTSHVARNHQKIFAIWFDSLWNAPIPCSFVHPAKLHCPGCGVHPSSDPWGEPFSEAHHPHRMRLAGTRLSGPYCFALDGIQGDADFIAALFSLKRHLHSYRIFLAWISFVDVTISPSTLYYVIYIYTYMYIYIYIYIHT